MNKAVDLLASNGSASEGPLAEIQKGKVTPLLCSIKMKVVTITKDGKEGGKTHLAAWVSNSFFTFADIVYISISISM